jgi:hypothetical protein
MPCIYLDSNISLGIVRASRIPGRHNGDFEVTLQGFNRAMTSIVRRDTQIALGGSAVPTVSGCWFPFSVYVGDSSEVAKLAIVNELSA